MEYTKCLYRGTKVNERMESSHAVFTFSPETGAKYEGEMKDGMFHGRGTLTLKNGAKIDGLWHNGVLVERKYIFSDGLEFNEDVDNWEYCRPPTSADEDGTKQWNRKYFGDHAK